MTRHVLALTLGDPVGIGPEITAKTLAGTGTGPASSAPTLKARSVDKTRPSCGPSARRAERPGGASTHVH